MPDEKAVRMWALQDGHPFYPHYTRARAIAYHRMADDIVEISDNGTNDWMKRNDEENGGYTVNGEHVQRSRLRVDSRKWVLSKMLPKIYGDKVVQEHVGANGGPIQTEQRVLNINGVKPDAA